MAVGSWRLHAVGVADGGPRIVTVLAVSVGRVVLPANCTPLGWVPSEVVDTLAPALIGSEVETVVPLSVMLELVGAPPAPPPFTRMFVFRMAEDVRAVVLLKYGMPPEVVVPETVSGNARETLPQPVHELTVIAGEPDNPPDVPVVFWLNVGKLVMFAALMVGAV
jgi:hypothetical protein